MKIFGFVTLMLVATWLFWKPESKTNPSESMAAEEEEQDSTSTTAQAIPKPKLNKTSFSARVPPKLDTAPRPSMTEAEFVNLLRKTDLETVLSVNDLVQRLRSEDSLRVSKYFSNQLLTIGDTNSTERSRLFQIANALQSDALLPFWQDLAVRKTAAYANEATLIQAVEPSFDFRVVMSEMSMAVRNLGLISYRDPAAGEILKGIALNANSDLNPTVIRQYAYEALKESDQVAGMQIIRSLKKDDPLRMRLITDARSSK